MQSHRWTWKLRWNVYTKSRGEGATPGGKEWTIKTREGTRRGPKPWSTRGVRGAAGPDRIHNRGPSEK